MTLSDIRNSEFYRKNVRNAEPQIQLGINIDEEILAILAANTGVQCD